MKVTPRLHYQPVTFHALALVMSPRLGSWHVFFFIHLHFHDRLSILRDNRWHCVLKLFGGVVARKVDHLGAIMWTPIDITFLVKDITEVIGGDGNWVSMETLDEHKGSFGCTIDMKCGCMVVGTSCLKEGWGAREKTSNLFSKTRWTKIHPPIFLHIHALIKAMGVSIV
jgi:hypothetical protein